MTDYVVTRWYRAPELLCDNQTYDKKVDVWSAGLILAELIVRRPARCMPAAALFALGSPRPRGPASNASGPQRAPPVHATRPRRCLHIVSLQDASVDSVVRAPSHTAGPPP